MPMTLPPLKETVRASPSPLFAASAVLELVLTVIAIPT